MENDCISGIFAKNLLQKNSPYRRLNYKKDSKLFESVFTFINFNQLNNILMPRPSQHAQLLVTTLTTLGRQFFNHFNRILLARGAMGDSQHAAECALANQGLDIVLLEDARVDFGAVFGA